MFTSTLWRSAILSSAGGLWWLVGALHDSRMQPVVLCIALGMSVAVILMVACDQTEKENLQDDLRSALRTMESMRRRKRARISRTPPGGVPRVNPPQNPPQAGRTQSRGQSVDVKPRLDMSILRWTKPRVRSWFDQYWPGVTTQVQT